MATGHNTWILDGRLAYEPELRSTPQGHQVCTLRLCWSEKIGSKENTVFVNAVCWRALAQTAARYLHKGDLVGVTGKVTGKTVTKKDGGREYVMEINVDELTFFPQSGKNTGERVVATEANEQEAPLGYPQHMEDLPYDDEIPF